MAELHRVLTRDGAGAGGRGRRAVQAICLVLMAGSVIVTGLLAVRTDWNALHVDARGVTGSPLVLPAASSQAPVVFVATDDAAAAGRVRCRLQTRTTGFLSLAITGDQVVDGHTFYPVASVARTWAAGDTVTCTTPDGVRRPALLGRVERTHAVQVVGFAAAVTVAVWVAALQVLLRTRRTRRW